MTTRDGIRWFKENFQEKVENAVEGTPSDSRLHRRFACQETGHIWQTLRKKKLPIAEILELCVGDTLDPDSKSACKASLLEVRSKIAVRSDYIRGRNLSYRRHCFPQSSVGLTDANVSTSAPTAAPIRVELKTRLRSAAWSSRNLQHNSRLVAPDCAVGPLAASKIV